MSTDSPLDVLWSYFPKSEANNKHMNALYANMFKNHQPEVVLAVLHSHRIENKFAEPCAKTIKRMLDEARQQLASKTNAAKSDEDDSVRAMRAWAIQQIGEECRHWDARNVVKERIRAEWFAIPAERRPKPNTEMNFGPWLGMIAAAGGNTEAGRTFLESLTGCRDITKYDGMDNRELYAAYQRTSDAMMPRDVKRDVDEFKAWQDQMRGQKHKIRRAIAAHQQATKLLPGKDDGQ